MLANPMRQPDAVHLAGHVDVGENDIHRQARRQDDYRLLRIAGLDNPEIAISEPRRDKRPQNDIVLDDQNDRFAVDIRVVKLYHRARHGAPALTIF